MKISFKILIGLCFIWCLFICVSPLRHFEHVLRQFSLCSRILHHLCTLLHVRCLTKCPSDIFVLNWTQVSSNTWILSQLIMLIMFWSILYVVYILGPIYALLPCLAHTKHTSCISCCIPMHHMLHTHASAHAQHRHTHAQLLNSCIVLMLIWFNTFSLLFKFIYSVLSWLCSVLGCFTYISN